MTKAEKEHVKQTLASLIQSVRRLCEHVELHVEHPIGYNLQEAKRQINDADVNFGALIDAEPDTDELVVTFEKTDGPLVSESVIKEINDRKNPI